MTDRPANNYPAQDSENEAPANELALVRKERDMWREAFALAMECAVMQQPYIDSARLLKDGKVAEVARLYRRIGDARRAATAARAQAGKGEK